MNNSDSLKIIALIPARMGSSRFPGKPMELINSKPMIGHVYHQVKKNKQLNDIAIATCDEIIYNYIVSIGGKAIMTSNKHERASDRCAEALMIIEKKEKIKYDIVVMVQGDEPLVHPNMISEAIQPMINNPEILVTNLLGKIENNSEFEDFNCIKVVCDKNNNALYFSRQPIPTNTVANSIAMGKQVCIIPFKRDFLFEYLKMDATPLEIAESVDMMRVLEHGFNVRMVPTDYITYAVDTPSDLQRVQHYLNQDKNE